MGEAEETEETHDAESPAAVSEKTTTTTTTTTTEDGDDDDDETSPSSPSSSSEEEEEEERSPETRCGAKRSLPEAKKRRPVVVPKACESCFDDSP